VAKFSEHLCSFYTVRAFDFLPELGFLEGAVAF
jgi:hypothetical protein